MRRNAIAVAAIGLSIGLTAPAVVAAPEHLETIETECGKQLKLSSAGCTCMRERASKLNDTQLQFVVAAILSNRAEQSRIQQTMSGPDMMGAITFMTQAPAECSK